MVLYAHDYLSEAERCFVQAEKLDAADPRWPYLQARTLLKDPLDPGAGLRCLERAVQRAGDVPAPRLRLASALLVGGLVSALALGAVLLPPLPLVAALVVPVVAAVALLDARSGLLTAVVGGVSKAAAPKDYQFTGTVTEIDAKSKTISVDKAGDVWEFSTSGRDLAKDLTKVKKGDKITVRYYMVVKSIESK